MGSAKGDKQQETHKYTIFLLEDDVSDKNAIIQTLQRSPYVHNVHWFASGEEMLKHFEASGYYNGYLIHKIPTIILCDVHMPGIDGIGMLKRMREHPATSDIPMIMITGDTSKEIAARAYNLRANAYMAKPIHLDSIHDVMTTGWGWPVTSGATPPL